MDRLIAGLEEQLGVGWVEVVEFLRSQNSVDDIAAAIARGDIDGAVQGITDAATRWASHANNATDVAGRAAAEWLDGKVDGSLISYDTANPRAIQHAQLNRYHLIREVTDDQREMVRQVVTRGNANGTNPLTTAEEVRTGIGLTAAQEAIVANYRRELRTGDYQGALNRELSSGHSDRVVRNAMRDGRVLTEQQINTAVDRYRDNWTMYRAQTISRTETLRAVHEGSHELYEQALDKGQISREEISREWVVGPRTGKDSPRPWHASMDEQRRGLGEYFVDGHGNRLAYPGDPRAPGDTTINCRCVVSTRYNPA